MDVDGIWHAVETCWSDEHHILFPHIDQYSRETTLLMQFDFCQGKKEKKKQQSNKNNIGFH